MANIRLIATLLAVVSIAALAIAAPSGTESTVSKPKTVGASSASTAKPPRLVSGIQPKKDDDDHQSAAGSDKLPEGAALRRRRDTEESEESEEERSGVAGSSSEAVKKPVGTTAHAEVAKPEDTGNNDDHQSFIPKRPATLPPRQKLAQGVHLSRDVSTTKAPAEESSSSTGDAEDDAVKVPTRRPLSSKLSIHKREAPTTKTVVKAATTTSKPKVHRREATGKPVSGSKVTAAPPTEIKRPASPSKPVTTSLNANKPIHKRNTEETPSRPATRPLAVRPSSSSGGSVVDAKVSTGRSTTLKPHVVHERETGTGAKVTSKTGRSTTPKSVHRREALSPAEHTGEDVHEVSSTKSPVRAPLTRVPVRLLSTTKAPEVPKVAHQSSSIHRRSAGAQPASLVKPTSSSSASNIHAKPQKSSEVHESHETISVEKHETSDASLHRQRRSLDSIVEKKTTGREVDVVVLPVLIRQMPPIIFRADDDQDETTLKSDSSDTSDETTSKTKLNFDIGEVIKPSLKSFFKSRFDKEAKEALRFRRSALDSMDKDASGEIGSVHMGTASTTAQPGILDSFIKLFKPSGENGTHDGSTPTKSAAAPTEALPSSMHGSHAHVSSTSKPQVTLGYHNVNNGQTVQELQVSTDGVRVPRPSSDSGTSSEVTEVQTTAKVPVSHREKRQTPPSSSGFPGNRPAAVASNAQKQPSRPSSGSSSTSGLAPRPKRTPIGEEFGAAEVEAPVPSELAYQGDFQSQQFEQQQQQEQQYSAAAGDFEVDDA